MSTKFNEMYESVMAEAKKKNDPSVFTREELEMAEEFSSGDESAAGGMGTSSDNKTIIIDVEDEERKIKKVAGAYVVSGPGLKKTIPFSSHAKKGDVADLFSLERAVRLACKN